MGDVTAEELAHLLGLATRRVHELEAELEALKRARTPGPRLRLVLAAAEEWSRYLVGVAGPDETLEEAIDELRSATRKRAGD